MHVRHSDKHEDIKSIILVASQNKIVGIEYAALCLHNLLSLHFGSFHFSLSRV